MKSLLLLVVVSLSCAVANAIEPSPINDPRIVDDARFVPPAGGGFHGGGGGGFHGGGPIVAPPSGGGFHGGGVVVRPPAGRVGWAPGWGPHPGWNPGWRWVRPEAPPIWWLSYAGNVPWQWVNTAPPGFWQCTAFSYDNGNGISSYPEIGEIQDQAAYDALEACGGPDFEQSGCYIPEGYCQIVPAY